MPFSTLIFFFFRLNKTKRIMNTNDTIRPVFPFFQFQNLPFLPKVDGGDGVPTGNSTPSGGINPFLGKGTFPSPVSSPPSPKQAESLDLSKKVKGLLYIRSRQS